VLLANSGCTTHGAFEAGRKVSMRQSQPIESCRAPVNGIKMYYEVHGGGDGVPLVLLHGAGSAFDVTFGRVLPVFAGSRRVIAVEEQGHGRTSGRDAPVAFETSADDVAALLRYLKVDMNPQLAHRGIISMEKTNSGPKAAKENDSLSQLIDARINDLTDWRGETLARVRMLIKQADPDVVEEVKWRKPSNPAGVPVWSHAGIICTGETYKDKVKLTFARGASLADPSGLFNSSLEGNTRRAIDFHQGDTIDEKGLKALIRAAVALNTSARIAARLGARPGARPIGSQKKPKSA
jgi:hypothetical protein